MNFFQRRRILKKANLMEMTPVRIHRHEVNKNGLVELIVPKFTNEYLLKFLIPRNKSSHFTIKLDSTGSETWLAIDGVKNVQRICSDLELKLGEKIHPSQDRVSKFLMMLYEQRYITFRELLQKKEKK